MSIGYDALRKLTGGEQADAELAHCITAASTIRTTILEPESSMATGLLDLIELYLAGHFWVHSFEGGGVTYTRAGMSEERYKTFGSVDSYGFLTTRFGQMAVALDQTDLLSELSKKDKVSFDVESLSSARLTAEPAGD